MESDQQRSFYAWGVCARYVELVVAWSGAFNRDGVQCGVIRVDGDGVVDHRLRNGCGG